jgi:hypothetical protein
MTELQHFEKGVFGVVGHAIGKVLRNGLIALIVGVAVGEALGITLNPTPGVHAPNLFVHVAAAALGVVLAFGVAMTTALTEAIQGALAAVRAAAGEAGQVAGTGLRDVGQAVQSVEQSVEHREHKP